MGLLKLKWPPLGYQNNERNFLATTRGLSEDRKRHLYQRRSYRKQISTPICLTYEKLNLMKSPTNALVSGNCDGAILNACMYHQPNVISCYDTLIQMKRFCYTVGYGRTHEHGETSTQLLATKVTIRPIEVCKKVYYYVNWTNSCWNYITTYTNIQLHSLLCLGVSFHIFKHWWGGREKTCSWFVLRFWDNS